MPMLFCKKCNGILKIRKWEGQEYLVCRKCKTKIKSSNNSIYLTEESSEYEDRGAGAAENNKKIGYEFKCPECGNNKCKVIDLGIMYGDEDWIYLLRCTNCDYGERIGEMG
jgi:DNA-directed RNA polymerase subunit M/transcription elongation factor TFIIS